MPQNIVQSSAHPNRRALRQLLMAQRQCVSYAERSVREQQLIQVLVRYIERYDALAHVALYMPHAGEPDLLGMMQCIPNPVCLPVVIGNALPLQFASWQVGEPLRTDRYGIAVPVNQRWVQPDVLFIPCLGFNSRQYRLGYGAGYYDRTLAQLRGKGLTVATVGVAWRQAACQFEPISHDVAMDVMLLA